MTIIGALPFNLTNGTTADATQVMADFNEIVNDTNNNAAHNGVNSDITSLTALTTPITPAQGGANVYFGAGGGTANVQTVPTPSPSNFTLTAGNTICWIPSVENSGATTLSVNGTTATAVLFQSVGGLAPLVGGEIVLNQLAKATYDGTQWVLDMDPMVGFGNILNLASATTTDLGKALTHSVNITGTTTITSFGSSATTSRPLYKLVFSGALILTYNATSLILPGSGNITTANGDAADALYLGSGNWQIIAYFKRTGQSVGFNPAFIQNYISGLTLSTAGASGTFGIASGVATDSANAVTMLLASAYTKTTSSWAVGSGNGALDTGTIAPSTWYHVFLIQRPDTGVVDVLFSLSATSPTLPTNYTLFRRIGAMKTDGSNHWLGFTQTGSIFNWSVPVHDLSAFTVANTRSTVALSVPPGVVVKALMKWSLNAATGTSVNICALTETDAAVGTNSNTNLQAGNGAVAAGQFEVLTNTSAAVAVRAATATAATLDEYTYGWIDYRGTA